MGWGNCGEDSKGRPIGYLFEAICDHPGCEEKINRGLSYACGGMHGQNERDCENYFCGKHLYSVEDPNEILHQPQLCEKCKNEHYEYLIEELMDEIKELKAALKLASSSMYGKINERPVLPSHQS